MLSSFSTFESPTPKSSIGTFEKATMVECKGPIVQAWVDECLDNWRPEDENLSLGFTLHMRHLLPCYKTECVSMVYFFFSQRVHSLWEASTFAFLTQFGVNKGLHQARLVSLIKNLSMPGPKNALSLNHIFPQRFKSMYPNDF